jgi:hypothetical protein
MISREEALAQINYLEKELFNVAPLPLEEKNFPHGFNIQIREGGRNTKWLKITPEQLKMIEDVLLGVPKKYLTDL